MGARRQRYVQQLKLSAAGAGSVSFTFRGDVRILKMRTVIVTAAGGTPTNQATALVELNSDDFDGSFTANNDTSDVDHLAVAGDTLTVTWSGADALAVATYTVWGVEYDAGTGISSVYGSGVS